MKILIIQKRGKKKLKKKIKKTKNWIKAIIVLVFRPRESIDYAIGADDSAE